MHPESKIEVFTPPDGPGADEQATTKALLLAYGSDEVNLLFEGWEEASRKAISLVHEITYYKSRDGAAGQVAGLLEKLRSEARPEEKVAREALAKRINRELRSDV